MSKIIECIPNLSISSTDEGYNEVVNFLKNQKNIEFKCADSGIDAHRTVFTYFGEIDDVLKSSEGLFHYARKYIDMRTHKGTHPRFGAVDVMPFVAMKNINSDELAPIIDGFAKDISEEYKVPIFLYEHSSKSREKQNLFSIRKGEYEELETKLNTSKAIPDYGSQFNAKMGATAMGVRDILVAFNINLDTKNVAIAEQIAKELRHSGYKYRENGQWKRKNGICKGVKAIGWYISDFDKIQVSMNIVDVLATPVHIAFEECSMLADKYHTQVTGSELIGCIPHHCLVAAGKYFTKNELISNNDAITVAIDTLNLNEVKPFDRVKNVIDFKR